MDHDHTGQLIFCGDAQVCCAYSFLLSSYYSSLIYPTLFALNLQGSIYTVKMDSHTGNLSRSHRNRSSSKQKSPVTTVQYRTFSLLSRGPVLLSFTRDGSLFYFRSVKNGIHFTWRLEYVAIINTLKLLSCSVSLEIQGYLTLRCSLRLGPRLHSIRASFCPLLSLEKGEYIGIYINALSKYKVLLG